MSFKHNIRFYGVGFLLGCVLVYFLFKGRSFPSMFPGDVLMEKLKSSHLIYTRHALCRMDCREINETEVGEILQKGSVNFRKSRTREKPCPSYAIEGFSSDGQHIRLVIATCDTIAKVITVIDLDRKYTCDCH